MCTLCLWWSLNTFCVPLSAGISVESTFFVCYQALSNERHLKLLQMATFHYLAFCVQFACLLKWQVPHALSVSCSSKPSVMNIYGTNSLWYDEYHYVIPIGKPQSLHLKYPYKNGLLTLEFPPVILSLQCMRYSILNFWRVYCYTHVGNVRLCIYQ